MFFRQRNVRRQVPRFEFIGVNRFSAIVFGEAVAQIVRGTNVSLVGMCFASQEVDVVHGARLRLPGWNLGILSWFGCRRVRVAVTFGATAGTRLRLPDWNLGILSWFGCRRVRVAVTFGATAGTRLRLPDWNLGIL